MKAYESWRRILPEEWEKDIEWRSQRLAFIWGISDEKPDVYMANGLYKEKADFYYINDSKVAARADKIYYGGKTTEELLEDGWVMTL